jgi:hypothetical protein
VDLHPVEAVVLHPDEFVAALNPEFMIEFARSMLGGRPSCAG